MENTTSPRAAFLHSLSNETFDLLVIGGGITGAGIALDAQTRGLKTVLVEMNDFASGTSGRSTKLIHGGLRYLKQLEFKLVAEVGRERAIVYNNARHVTHAEKMLLPLYKNGSIGYVGASAGLLVYDLLAGVKRNERRQMLDRGDVLGMEPLLNPEGLQGGVAYYEYRTDDARLTMEVAKAGASYGAKLANYVKVIDFLYDGQKVAGVKAKDTFTGNEILIKARQVVNAAGPWVDSVDVLDNAAQGEKLFLTKGVHIVIKADRLPIRQSLYFDVPGGRMIFAIPRDGVVYIGTTDTAYQGQIEAPQTTLDDQTYLLKALQHVFPKVALKEQDITASWSGVRPLIRQKGKSPSEVSRKDEIFEHPSGLISIAGGKLTGYRLMASRAVDLVAKRARKQFQQNSEPCTTERLKLSGGNFESDEDYLVMIQRLSQQAVDAGLNPNEGKKLALRYGTNLPELLIYVPPLLHQPADELPVAIKAELMYCVESEFLCTLSDFFIRRTSAMHFDTGWVIQYKYQVADYLGQLLGWSAEERAAHLATLENQLTAMHPVE